VLVISLAAVGIITASLLFPKPAFAPHANKSSSKKDTTKQVLYVRCPHCGEKIKMYVVEH